MSRRVLGQYDLLVAEDDSSPGATSPDVVYFVGPNLLALEKRFAFPPTEFRLWVALHELTHRAQFTGVDWMRPYFLGLMDEVLQAAEPDPRRLIAALRRCVEAVREGRNPLDDGGLVALLATPSQREALDRVGGLMSLLEGHGDVTMDRAGAHLIPSAPRFGAVLRARRQSQGWPRSSASSPASKPSSASTRTASGSSRRSRRHVDRSSSSTPGAPPRTCPRCPRSATRRPGSTASSRPWPRPPERPLGRCAARAGPPVGRWRSRPASAAARSPARRLAAGVRGLRRARLAGARRAGPGRRHEVEAWHVDHGCGRARRPTVPGSPRCFADIGVPVHVVRVEVGPGPNLEERAVPPATARCPGRSASPTNPQNRHDLAETVLVNVLRGTGLDGLGPMRSGPEVVRPLLGLRRRDNTSRCARRWAGSPATTR